MKVTVSRAYFGRSAHMNGPGAYLSIDTEDHVRDVSSDALRQLLPGIDEAIGFQKGTLKADDLSLREALRRTVEAMLDDVGLSGRARVNTDTDQDNRTISLTVLTHQPEVARRAGELSVRMLGSLVGPQPAMRSALETEVDFNSERDAFARFAAGRQRSVTSDAITAAAEARGIPVIQFDRWPFVRDDDEAESGKRDMLQLGQGCHQRRMIGTALMPPPPITYEVLADRQETIELLAKAGIPVPGRDPEFTNVNRAQRAVRSAGRIGYPVVVKPRMRAPGQPISLGLANDVEVVAAYERASRSGGRVVVEEQVEGDSFRLLVIGGNVSALREIPSRESAQEDSDSSLSPVEIGDELLATMHPAVKATAAKVAATLGVEIAEVKIVTSDLSKPLAETDGAVVEINAAPDLAPYCMAGEVFPEIIAGRLVDHLFPPGTPSRVPIVSVTGTNGKTTTCRIVARILKEAGYTVGLACTEGVYVDGILTTSGTYSGISGALSALQGSKVDAVVLETSRGTLVDRGLAFDFCEVAACTNVAADHIGERGIDTVDQMAELKRIVVESARDWAVLNGMDLRCRAMVPHLVAKTVCLVATEPRAPEVQAHIEQGGTAVVLEHDGGRRLLKFRRGDQVTVLGDVADFPLTWGGLAEHNVENLMHAVGLALGLGVNMELIQRVLRTIGSSIEVTPGRLNRYDKLPFQVILDFAHNAHGLSALSRFARRLACRGRRMLVFFGRERDREGDIMNMAAAVAADFDFFVCRDPVELREFAPGELSTALSNALERSGVAMDRIAVIPSLKDAVDFALRACEEGDVLVVVSGKKFEDTWRQLEEYRQNLKSENTE